VGGFLDVGGVVDPAHAAVARVANDAVHVDDAEGDTPDLLGLDGDGHLAAPGDGGRLNLSGAAHGAGDCDGRNGGAPLGVEHVARVAELTGALEELLHERVSLAFEQADTVSGHFDLAFEGQHVHARWRDIVHAHRVESFNGRNSGRVARAGARATRN
jgi:hypothetical protein